MMSLTTLRTTMKYNSRPKSAVAKNIDIVSILAKAITYRPSSNVNWGVDRRRTRPPAEWPRRDSAPCNFVSVSSSRPTTFIWHLHYMLNVRRHCVVSATTQRPSHTLDAVNSYRCRRIPTHRSRADFLPVWWRYPQGSQKSKILAL